MGDLVVGMFGWCTHFIVTADYTSLFGNQIQKLDPTLYKGRESTAVGILGMPG